LSTRRRSPINRSPNDARGARASLLWCPSNGSTGSLARYKATTTLALHLLHRAFKERHHIIKVANGLLALKGISRRQKWRALLDLEGMGLIKVEHRGRRSPVITLLFPRDES
jgi:hypothetical protein